MQIYIWQGNYWLYGFSYSRKTVLYEEINFCIVVIVISCRIVVSMFDFAHINYKQHVKQKGGGFPVMK